MPLPRWLHSPGVCQSLQQPSSFAKGDLPVLTSVAPAAGLHIADHTLLEVLYLQGLYTSPPYSWGKYSKTNSGRLRLQIIPNPMYIFFIYIHPYDKI